MLKDMELKVAAYQVSFQIISVYSSGFYAPHFYAKRNIIQLPPLYEYKNLKDGNNT